MVTNWCCGLSAIRGRSTYRNETHFSESRQGCFVATGHSGSEQHGEDSVANMSNGLNRWFLTVGAITLTQSLKPNKCCFPLECLDLLFYLLYLLLFVWPEAIIHLRIMSETLNLSLEIKSWAMFMRGRFGLYPNSNQHEPHYRRLQGGKASSQRAF